MSNQPETASPGVIAARLALTHPLPLCSTFLNVMQTPGANASFLPVLRIAVSIPGLRISGHNARAGNEA